METKKSKNTKKMLVRYGKLGYLGWFDHNELELPQAPRKVIIKTDRGLEMGEMLGTGCYKHGNYKGKVVNLPEYYEVADDEYPIGYNGQFVRFATKQDINEARHVRESAIDELKICRRYVAENNLQMKIVDFEHIFGGERIVFYFVSDGRVDFRDLVRQLAKEFQTRIEMRQIGARDEERLISYIETCGQQCCCSKYLKILKPVNMRMAKTQKATLDPSKISGHCGRLRCCLRYEDQTYQDLKSNMPNRQTVVNTPNGVGKVIDYQILTQLVQVLYEDGKIEAVPIEDINASAKCGGCCSKQSEAVDDLAVEAEFNGKDNDSRDDNIVDGDIEVSEQASEKNDSDQPEKEQAGENNDDKSKPQKRRRKNKRGKRQTPKK